MLSLTGEKYNYLRTKQLKMKEEGLRLMSDEQVPVMPEMQELMTLPPPDEQSLPRMELSSPHAVTTPAETSDSTTPAGQPAAGAPHELPPFIQEDDAGRTPQ